ncbi:MAG: L,D-transpeptidase [Verrucomicrobiales bacterium]|nr:L,D-transpeptidase [Verrucomicrobiales bacterium]
MKRRTFLASCAATLPVSGSLSGEEAIRVRIELNPDQPELSQGTLTGDDSTFPVGLGKHGILPAGESFRGGYSLLGTFSINAILTAERFEMTEELIRQSGKSRDWLRENLFRNMSSIDFDGDGEGGEYGEAFLGLEPTNSKADQPFHFGEYKSVFRWYSYAIHGTQDESRIGKCVTGGCINAGRDELGSLAALLKLGDLVSITASGAAPQ